MHLDKEIKEPSLSQNFDTCTSKSKDDKKQENVLKLETCVNKDQTDKGSTILYVDKVESESAVKREQKDDNMIACKTCSKNVIKANIQLHELHCARGGKVGDKQNHAKKEKNRKNLSASKSSQSRHFDKVLAKKVNDVDKDDFDALIDAVQKLDSSCCFKKCKTSVQTLFNVCMHCNGRYCMSHHIPEVHGCGDAARAQARSQIIKDGVLHRGSGVPDKHPDSAKKAHLQRKLDSKLADLSSKRKSKPKK